MLYCVALMETMDQDRKRAAMQKNQTLPSGTMAVACLLSLSGGFLDAYSFFNRGGVFANAQTGNIVMLGACLVGGQNEVFLKYLIPIIAFLLGIFLAVVIETTLNKLNIRFVRRSVLLLEAAILVFVAFLPEGRENNVLANTLVSFICAAQMETFKSFRGEPIATTMSTGNLRKFAENFYLGFIKKEFRHHKTAVQYLVVLLMFTAGAALGAVASGLFSVLSALIPAGLLLCAAGHITVAKRAG